MHKGRHKAGGGSTSAATTSSSLLPVAESPGRDGLYRTASGGTPSKWRSGGKVAAVLPWAGQPRRRLHTALALLALLLCALLLSASRPSQQQVDAALPKQQQQLLLQVGEEQALIRQALGIQRHQEQQLGGHHASYLPEPAPRVALLFLVRGHMPLEPLWQAFFETAAQIEPVSLPQHTRQDQQRLRRLAGGVAADADAWLEHAGVEAADDDAATAVAVADAAGDLTAAADAEQLEQAGQQQEGEAAALAAAGASGQGLDAKLLLEGRRVAQGGLQAQDLSDGVQLQQQVPVTALQQQQLEANKHLAEALGSGERVQEAQRQAQQAQTMVAPYSMMSPLDPLGPIARQRLFSVYVHTMPGFHYHNTSIFSGYQVDHRVFVSWGQYTVAEAERRLIQAALANPHNQRFVLISETCTPLYPPHVFYLQLLSEQRSRVNACAKEGGGIADRWNSALYMPGVLNPWRWRKSSQWKVLVRAHAEIVAGDKQLAPRFERECYSYFPPTVERPAYVVAQNRTWVARSCVADEHYIPTLLAVHQKDNETTCADALTAADWILGLWSPKVHHKAEINAALIQRLRKQRGTEVDCDAVGAAASAATLFRRHGSSTTLAGQPLPARGNGGGSSIWSWGPFRLLGRRRLRQTQQQDDRVAGGQQQQAADQGQQRHQQGGEGARRQAADLLQRHYYKPLSDTCYLVARKFAPDAVLALMRLAEDCQQGTAISPGCLPDRRQQ